MALSRAQISLHAPVKPYRFLLCFQAALVWVVFSAHHKRTPDRRQVRARTYVFSFTAEAQRRKAMFPVPLRLCVFAFARFTPSLNTFARTTWRIYHGVFTTKTRFLATLQLTGLTGWTGLP